MQLIEENRGMVYDKVNEESYLFVPKFVNNKLADKITDGLIKYFHEVSVNEQHPIRKELDIYLQQLFYNTEHLPPHALSKTLLFKVIQQ